MSTVTNIMVCFSLMDYQDFYEDFCDYFKVRDYRPPRILEWGDIGGDKNLETNVAVGAYNAFTLESFELYLGRAIYDYFYKVPQSSHRWPIPTECDDPRMVQLLYQRQEDDRFTLVGGDELLARYKKLKRL